jgi:oligogalacturonide lyase
MFARRYGGSLLYASDVAGTLQAYLLDLKTFESHLQTEARRLDAGAMCLTPDDRLLCYRDGEALMVTAPGTLRARQVYEWSGGAAGGAIHTIPDGPAALVVEGGTRLVAVNLARGGARTVAENAAGIVDPLPRPRRASIAYRTGEGTLGLANLDGTRNVALKTPAGRVGPARWAPDGRTLLYLHFPEAGAKTSHLRELNPDTGEDKLVAVTSQYAQFSPNGDASVFVGASASAAQPHILLMLRSVRRELTLCEHRSSDAAATAPVFSPDSQRIFFQSDRQGKLAVYFMAVERLVEKTESQ